MLNIKIAQPGPCKTPESLICCHRQTAKAPCCAVHQRRTRLPHSVAWLWVVGVHVRILPPAGVAVQAQLVCAGVAQRLQRDENVRVGLTLGHRDAIQVGIELPRTGTPRSGAAAVGRFGTHCAARQCAVCSGVQPHHPRRQDAIQVGTRKARANPLLLRCTNYPSALPIRFIARCCMPGC